MYRPNFIIKWLFPALYRVKGEQSLFFTFDDGPCPETTREILAILRQHNIKATFFVVGENILRYPDLMSEIINEGHQIGNHTMHHTDGFKVSTTEYIRDVEQCQRIIETFTTQQVKIMRPPHGHIRWSEMFRLRKIGYQIVQWDVIAHDWEADRSIESVVDIVHRYSRPGSIIVLHDSHKAAARSIPALRIICDTLSHTTEKSRTSM